MAARPYYPLAIDKGLSCRRQIKTGAYIEQRTLAASARPDKGDYFAVRDREAHALDRRDVRAPAGVGKAHRHVAEFQPVHAGALCLMRIGVRAIEGALVARL